MSNDTRLQDSLSSAGQVVTGQELVDSPASSLLYDRIINIKFIRKDGTHFIIRSDYEPVFHKDGTVQFVKCAQKPAITLSYNQVADTTAVNVQIKIESLFIDREAAGEQIDSASGNPVMSAVVQLGYFDEFPRWDRVAGSSDIDSFYAMDNDALAGYSGLLSGKQMIVQILNCYPESNPPDRSWVFIGTVATLDTGLRWEHQPTDLVPGYNNADFPRKLSKIEAMFFQWITRRFVRAGIQHTVVTEKVYQHDGTAIDSSVVSIYGYRKYVPDADGKLAASDNTWTTLKLDTDGLMTPKDASYLGVICTCSEELRQLSTADIPKYGVWQPDEAVSQALQSVLAGLGAGFQLFDEAYQTMDAQLNAIHDQYSFIRWYLSMDGNLFIYKKSEDSNNNLILDPAIKANQVTGKVIKLAAVYDITMSGMRVIRCPFRQLINPMTTVLFVSRYRILDTIGSFYQPSVTHDAFLVLLSSVEFSTVGDANMMTLSCVDIPDDQAPIVDFETGQVQAVPGIEPSVQDYTDNPMKFVLEVENSWAPVSVTLGLAPYDQASFTWVDIANSLLKGADPADWPDGLPTIAQALADLKEWNSPSDSVPGAWASGETTIPYELGTDDQAPDNWMVPGLPFVVPWLFAGTTIVLHLPYKQTPNLYYKLEGVTLNGH